MSPDAPRPSTGGEGRESNKVVGDAAGTEVSNSQRQLEGEGPRHVTEGRRPLLLQWLAARNQPQTEITRSRDFGGHGSWVLDVARPATFTELLELGVIDTDALAIPVGAGGAP